MSFPVFYGNGGDDATVMIVQVKNDKGEVKMQGNLVINGRTGKLAMRDRTVPVAPMFEKLGTPKKKGKQSNTSLDHV